MDTLSPWLLLGLPDPAEKKFQDTKLITTYQDFCKILSRDPAGRFIKCDGEFFFPLDDWIEQKDFSRLHLLCALYHPNKTQTNNIRRRLSDFINYRGKRGIFSGHVYSPEILSSYRQFLEFRKSPDYKTLTKNTLAGKTIGTVETEHSPGPGLDYFSELHLSKYNKDWAIVLYFGDAEDKPLEAFPTVLGFVGMDNPERNAVALLIKEELFTGCGWLSETGGVTDLLSLAWMRDDDYNTEDFNYASFFLQFSDEELNHFRKEYGGLTDEELLDKVADLYGYDEIIDLDKLVATYGPPTGPGYFEKVEAWIEAESDRRDREVEEESRETEEERREREQRYNERVIISPIHLEVPISQVTTSQCLSLQKWMREIAHLECCSVAFRSVQWMFGPKVGLYIFWEKAGRNYWKYCKATGSGPTVAEAFRQAFSDDPELLAILNSA